MTSFKVGDLVRYSHDWCTNGERKYIHVLKENRLNPITNEMSRWLIETINTNMVFNPTSVVEDYMIVPLGFNVDDLTE